MPERVLVAAAGLVVVLGGCPGGDDDGQATSDGGSSPPGVRDDDSQRPLDVCTAHIAWVERCQGEPDFSYTTEWGQSECPDLAWHYIEPAFIAADAECFETLPCTESDDACAEAGFMALGIEDETDIPDDPIFLNCSDRAAECEEVIGDVCTTLIAFIEAGRDAARDCFGLPCEQINDCVQNPQ